jgi:hypothetical protein
MGIKNYGLDKKQIALCDAMMTKYPKSIKTNNVVASMSAIISFYNSSDERKIKFYEYMNPERMVSLLWQITKSTHEKQEVKESAVRLLNKVLEKIVVN